MVSEKEDAIAIEPLAQQKSGAVIVSKQQTGDGATAATLEEGGVEYDPHKHRTPAHPTTNNETLIHMIKSCLGTGILAMPQAFSNSGLVNGVISTIIIGILCTYCLHVLVQAQYELCKRRRVPLLTYPESMKEALLQGPKGGRMFAPMAPALVDTFLIVYQIGICCVYIVFVATNIKKVADFYWTPIDERLWMCILLLPLVLLNFIKNLKVLAPFSQLANVIMFIGIGIVMYYIFLNMPNWETVEKERHYFGLARNYILYVGTTLFALEAVGVIIALENNMATPKSFGGTCGVLNIGMVIIVFLYVFVGLFGYITYGDASKGSITLNLDNSEILAQIVNILFAIAIFISYALQCYVPVEIIWGVYLKKRFENHKHKAVIENAIRTGVVFTTFAFAIAIPRLGLFISLFGALCLSALGIAFPAFMEICVLWPDNLGPGKYILWKDLILIVFGILALFIGTITSVNDIIASF